MSVKHSQLIPHAGLQTGQDGQEDRQSSLPEGVAAHLDAEALLHLDDASRNRVLNQRTRIVSEC